MAQWFKEYEAFLLKNASQISSIETTLRTFTYILPGRFHDAELASEALFAAINLLGLYHDALIVRALATRQHRIADDALTTDLTDRSTIDPSIHLHNRYIRTFWSTDKIYRSISLALTVIKATEVTIEMLALRRLSEEGRWRLVMKIEILKALLRFILLKRSGNRRLISPPHPLREVDPAMVEDAVSEVSNHVSMINGTTPTRHTWTGQRSGKDIAQLATVMTHRTGPKKQEFSISDLLGGGRESNDSVTEYILSKTLRPEDVLSGHYLVRVQRGWHLLGEWLYILRPIIYVMALRKYGLGAWRPWLISLSVELTAYMASIQNQAKSGPASTLDKAELSRRRRLLLLYLLRSPLYYTFTKSRLDGVRHWLSSKPLLSLLGNILGNYQPLWETIYFYTAGS